MVAFADRGLRCTKPFKKGDFLVEYQGRLLEEDPGDNIYTFEFSFKRKLYW